MPPQTSQLDKNQVYIRLKTMNANKSFYTSVFKQGDFLYLREIVNGQRKKRKIQYKPTLFIPTNAHTDWKTTDGKYVEPYKPGTMQESREFVEKYKEVDNFRVYGNTQFEYAFINEEYPGHIDYDVTLMRICNIDIEVETTDAGFSEPSDATNKITAITLKSSVDGVFHVFSYKPFTNNSEDPIRYYLCTDEYDLLIKFFELWEEIDPDIITGWNIRTFDIPYIINRTIKICGEDTAKRISPWRMYKQRTVNLFNKQNDVFDIAGVSVLDYLMIYRKNVLEPRESYRLDYIAQVELNERKVNYAEFGNLQALYENNFQKFVEYNIHDVRLVDRIDAKRKLIELQMIVAYDAKVNLEDVISQVRVWDTKICNRLYAQRIVIPQRSSTEKTAQYAGAYVMEPKPGMYDWVVSFDVAGLYPTIMRTLNMGIETKILRSAMTAVQRAYLENITPDFWLKNGAPDWTIFEDMDVTMSVSGVCYKREPKSFYSQMVEELADLRVQYRKKAQEAKVQKEATEDKKEKERLDSIIANFDLKQKATKVLMNSLYGALGNEYFRFFDVENAEAVTLTGQFILQFISKWVNAYLNKIMKTSDREYVIYGDTDSIYISIGNVVDARWPVKFDMPPQNEVVDFVDKLCKDFVEPCITKAFDDITFNYLHGVGRNLQMKREVIADKGIWTAKKRYLLNVHDSEGVRYHEPKIKFMGVEIAKASIPKFSRDAMLEAVKIVMSGDKVKLHAFVKETKEKFMKLPLDEVGFPRGVNGLTKYSDSSNIFGKGTPFHVKGALTYNFLVKKMGIESKYALIREGEKIKFLYMKEPNPYNTSTIAFLTIIPEEFEVSQYINWEVQFEKSFTEPLMLILRPIGWDVQKRASLDSMFEEDPMVVSSAVLPPKVTVEQQTQKPRAKTTSKPSYGLSFS